MSKLSQITFDSPLCQSVTREGETVQVKIYGSGQGRWLLEVVDEYGNSTVWDTSFESDQDALDEAFNTINEEGIDSLIGAPSDAIAAMTLNCPLSKAEWSVLDDFLGDEEIEQTSMDASTLDGFLTAIAIGPQIVPPSEWLSWVWDMEAGEAAPVFEDERQANRIMSLISRHYNSVVDTFNIDSASFTPIFWQDVSWGAAEWCEGFLLGFQFNEQDWSMLTIGQPAWMAPFLRLGTEDGIAITERANDADKWKNEIAPSITRIYEYWKSKHGNQLPVKFGGAFDFHAQKEGVTIVRDGPKIGRNDPCPCGSGKKFKKCCSVDATRPSLH